jgi:hypothetical protein
LKRRRPQQEVEKAGEQPSPMEDKPKRVFEKESKNKPSLPDIDNPASSEAKTTQAIE